jgi:hypothetical protein
MKALKLNGISEEQVLDANECLSLGLATTSGEDIDWKVLVTDGCIWLSFESSMGKHSATPLVDVVLRVGQSYSLSALALRSGVFVSTFEKSRVRLYRSGHVPSCNGKNDTFI